MGSAFAASPNSAEPPAQGAVQPGEVMAPAVSPSYPAQSTLTLAQATPTAPAANSGSRAAGQTAQATDSSGEQQPYLFSLKNKQIYDVGQYLAAHGVYLTAFDYAEISGVPAGGIKHGSFFTNWAVFGVNLDMQKIANIPGAQIHFIPDDDAGYGRNYGYTGADWSIITPYGNHDGLQLKELSWDQALFNDKLHVLFGRLNPKGGEFDGSDLYCLYATFLCSAPTTFSMDASPETFTTSSWGARVLYKPTENTYVKGGIYEDEPWIKLDNHGSWPGPDWDFNKSVGNLYIMEAGYKSSFSSDRYPRQYDIGFTYDTSTYSDPLYNTNGLPKPLYGGSYQTLRNRSTVYVQAQQMIWKPSADSHRGITVFATGNFDTSGESTVRDGYAAGLFWWGPFAQRPKDYFAVAAQTFLWNQRWTERMNDVLATEGYPDQYYGSSESEVEVNYGINVAPGITTAPYFEYIRNPDQMAMSVIRPGLTDAIQVGLMVHFEFNSAFDLPELARVRN